MKSLATSLQQTKKNFLYTMPILLGILMLTSIIVTIVPDNFYAVIFTQNRFLDAIIGALIGSVIAGNPINSYIIGGELLHQGIGLIATTAFIVSWVTVGLIQLPAEIALLGKRFAIVRNITSFCSAIIIAILVTTTLSLLQKIL